jgi:nitroimidazol reductase NimA-like FMN-containing flavoprotein (pyridoxamine 5'-phosphate oxidase superfamily)
MQRPLRRKDREIAAAEAQQLLARGSYGVLATVDADGQPYAVPLSYALHAGAIYFHSALDGHKLDNIRANAAVSFCVVGQTEVLAREFATRYESAVAFGSASEVAGDEKQAALIALLEKYSPDYLAQGIKYLAGKTDATRVVRIDIAHLSGKARR